MSGFSRPRVLSWLTLVTLAMLASLQGCNCGSTGADVRRFACTQDDECASGFVCRAGECQPEEPVNEPDGGPDEEPDAGPTDAGPTDGGSDGGPPDGGPSDGGPPDGGPGPQPTKLTFVSPPQTLEAGRCSMAVVLETQTFAGVAAPVGTLTYVGLSAQPGAGFNFYTDAACQNSTPTVMIAPGSSRATFYFRGTLAQAPRIIAETTGLTTAVQQQTIRPGPPALVAFVTGPQTVPAGGCSARVDLEVRDTYNNATFFSSQTRVALGAQDTSGFKFFSNVGCTTPITEAVFNANVSRSRFYFKGRTGGTFPLSATVAGLPGASQNETILPVVRTGECVLEVNEEWEECEISPPQLDLSKTMMMFQASSNHPDSATSNVRCSLTARDTITCYRQGDNAEITVLWQTAELLSGLKVQHLDADCGELVPVITLPIQSVSDPQHTFLLVSSTADGSQQGEDDFYTATLAAPDRVELKFSLPCRSSWEGSVQVVESTGLHVTRGQTGVMSGTELTVTLPEAVPLEASALLFTYRLSNTPSDVLCDRVLRGQLTSPTQITFTRGAGSTSAACTGAVIEAISWERLEFDTLGRAQHVQAEMEPATRDLTLTINPVDPTRTLVFASGQALSGQAGGECSYASDDLIGAALGWHGLLSPTQLGISREVAFGRARWFSTVLQIEP